MTNSFDKYLLAVNTFGVALHSDIDIKLRNLQTCTFSINKAKKNKTAYTQACIRAVLLFLSGYYYQLSTCFESDYVCTITPISKTK